MYQITHVYLTIDDDNYPTTETETADADDGEGVAPIIARMLAAPGGRSGTSIAVTVTPTNPLRI